MILIEPFNQSHKQNCDLEQISTAYIYFIAMLGTMGLKGGKGPWWSTLGSPGVLRKCREMPTMS